MELDFGKLNQDLSKLKHVSIMNYALCVIHHLNYNFLDDDVICSKLDCIEKTLVNDREKDIIQFTKYWVMHKIKFTNTCNINEIHKLRELISNKRKKIQSVTM